MKNKLVRFGLLLALAVGALFGQAAPTSTSLSAAVSAGTSTQWCLASATGVVLGSTFGSNGSFLTVDSEVARVTTQGSSATCFNVKRGQLGTSANAAHLNGALVWVDNAATSTGDPSRPTSGGNYSRVGQFFVAPTNCAFAPTTLTTTNTYVLVGASNVLVANGLSNAAAGTNTLVCTIVIPSNVRQLKNAVLTDITLFVGSQTTAPTSLGTATLGSITFPVAATTETASTVTPVTVGGTITTTSPTAITTVTTAGAFLTIKHAFSTDVAMTTDLQILRYTMPFLQSAAAAMAINTPGLMVHYREPLR